eukprot:331897_1
MHFHIYSLLAIFILSSARNFGKLHEADGEISCPSTPHRTIFRRIAGNWRLRADDPTYGDQIFQHLSGQFFTTGPLLDKTNVIVTLNQFETDYVIRDINDPVALQYAQHEGISLFTFGKNMLYHDPQYDMKCGLHSLNNLFQKTWMNPERALQISQTVFANGDKVYPVMYRELSSRTWHSFGHSPDVIIGAINYQGFFVDRGVAHDFGATHVAAYNADPQDTIFGIILQYNLPIGGHYEAIRRIGGVWWNLDSMSRSKKGTSTPKPCGATGNWAECKAFMYAKLAGGRGRRPGTAFIVKCPIPGDLTSVMRTKAMTNGIMPNLVNWREWCPASVPNLINQVCFGSLSHLRNEARYAAVMRECPDCTEALCQGIKDVDDRRNPVGKYHCRTDNDECEIWEIFGEPPYGSCDTLNNQCPVELPDCQNEPNWQGTLGKCVERARRSNSEYYERSINIMYWFLALDMLFVIGIGCLVMFMLFICGCFVLYYLKRRLGGKI